MTETGLLSVRVAGYSCVTDWDSVSLVTGREDQWS
jgi:hypothetical protein